MPNPKSGESCQSIILSPDYRPAISFLLPSYPFSALWQTSHTSMWTFQPAYLRSMHTPTNSHLLTTVCTEAHTYQGCSLPWETCWKGTYRLWWVWCFREENSRLPGTQSTAWIKESTGRTIPLILQILTPWRGQWLEENCSNTFSFKAQGLWAISFLTLYLKFQKLRTPALYP